MDIEECVYRKLDVLYKRNVSADAFLFYKEISQYFDYLKTKPVRSHSFFSDKSNLFFILLDASLDYPCTGLYQAYIYSVNKTFIWSVMSGNFFLSHNISNTPFFYDCSTGLFFHGLNQISAVQTFGGLSGSELIDAASISLTGMKIPNTRNCLVFKKNEKSIRYYYLLSDVGEISSSVSCKECPGRKYDNFFSGTDPVYDLLFTELCRYFYSAVKAKSFESIIWKESDLLDTSLRVLKEPLFLAKTSMAAFYAVTGIKHI